MFKLAFACIAKSNLDWHRRLWKYSKVEGCKRYFEGIIVKIQWLTQSKKFIISHITYQKMFGFPPAQWPYQRVTVTLGACIFQLRYNSHITLVSGVQQQILYCKIITLSVNIYHHKQLIFFLVMRNSRSTLSNFQTYNTVLLTTVTTLHITFLDDLLYNWTSASFDHFHPFHPSPPLAWCLNF